MPKRKFSFLKLRVRAADDPSWDADGRSKAARFDAGWASHAKGEVLPRMSDSAFISGWIAADTAWSTRHQTVSGAYR